MRRILVENARRKKAAKRGGNRRTISLDDAAEAFAADDADFLDLDTALQKLEAEEPLVADIVKLRYFAGLTMPQTAETLNLSLRTAERNWTYAKAWLHAELTGE